MMIAGIAPRHGLYVLNGIILNLKRFNFTRLPNGRCYMGNRYVQIGPMTEQQMRPLARAMWQEWRMNWQLYFQPISLPANLTRARCSSLSTADVHPSAKSAIEPNKVPATISPTIIAAVRPTTSHVLRSLRA